jgi:hypothetical protein
MAFKKIKTISKTFNSNLVSNPSALNSKYKKLNDTYISDNSFLLSTNYGLTRQHTLLSNKASFSQTTFHLDQSSFNKFLENNQVKETYPTTNLSIYESISNFNSKPIFLEKSSLLSPSSLANSKTKFNTQLSLIQNYPTTFKVFNANSDKSFLKHALKKIFNKGLNQKNLTNKSFLQNSSTED